jgi:hypothetical protein
MLFEAETLLRLARRSGISIQRSGEFLVVAGHAVTPIWLDAIKRHKPVLIEIVPLERGAADPGRAPGR